MCRPARAQRLWLPKSRRTALPTVLLFAQHTHAAISSSSSSSSDGTDSIDVCRAIRLCAHLVRAVQALEQRSCRAHRSERSSRRASPGGVRSWLRRQRQRRDQLHPQTVDTRSRFTKRVEPSWVRSRPDRGGLTPFLKSRDCWRWQISRRAVGVDTVLAIRTHTRTAPGTSIKRHSHPASAAGPPRVVAAWERPARTGGARLPLQPPLWHSRRHCIWPDLCSLVVTA